MYSLDQINDRQDTPDSKTAVTMLTEFDTQTSYPREPYVCTADALLVVPALVSESMLDDTRRRFNTCMRGQRSLLGYAVH
jgi:hypothetical protein